MQAWLGGKSCFSHTNVACEQALLFGRVKRVSRERASERRSREGQSSRVHARLASLAQIGEPARRLIQMLLTFCGRCNRYFWDIGLKILRLPDFNMVFEIVLTKFFQSELFSCLPKVDHVITVMQKAYYGIMMICVASFKLQWYTFETICYLILWRVHAIWPFKYSYGFRLQPSHTERTLLWMDGINSGSLSCIQHLFFRKEKVTGAEMCLAISCGSVTALDSSWTYFFPCPQ